MLGFQMALWCGMAALAVQFLYIGSRLRMDRTYLQFGLFLGLAAAVFALPLWGAPSSLGGTGGISGILLGAGLLILAILAPLQPPFRPALLRTAQGRGIPAAGLAAFALGLAADGFAGNWPPVPGRPCFSFWGMVACAASGTALVLRRYLRIVRENRETLLRLEEAYGRLREGAGLSELGASAAVISHEIRNYVSALKGNAVLMGGGTDPAPDPGSVEAIRQVTERMEAIAQDIAAFAGSTAPMARGIVSLDGVLRECIDRHFADRRGAFSVPAGAERFEVAGDPAKLEQVFLNLMRNSLEAGASRVEVRLTAWGGRIIAVLEDDGAGCPGESLARIATPFYTRKDAGTGLGCSIASEILKAHGASLRVYTKNVLPEGGRGFVANLVFPSAAAGPSSGREAVAAAETAEGRAVILQPLLNLGIRPWLVSLPEGAQRATAASGAVPWFFLEKGALPPTGGGPRAVLVDGSRVARMASPGFPSGDFLFTEEKVAGLFAGREAGR